jgi:tripartite ATP-independent transporter DctM subunit
MAVEISIGLALLIFVVLLALGVPVFVSMGLSSVAFLNTTTRLPPGLITDGLFTGLDSFALIAVPLFIFTGDAVFEAGIADDLLDFTETVVGGFRTGLGTATILGCGFFAMISGSNASDAAAIGRVTLGRLEEVGYTRSYASAMIASGASTGILIPPSITYIIAGIILGVPASTLFAVAFIPGLAILVGIMLTNVVMNRVRGYEHGAEFGSPREIGRAGWEAKFGLLIPVIILGGIYSGVFTPTESAAVAVGVALVIGGTLDTIGLRDYPEMLERSGLVNAMVSPIIAVGIVLSQVLSSIGLPGLVAETIAGISSNVVVVTLLMVFVFLIAGAVMEITPNIIILGPLFLPIAEAIGMNTFHFTVFFMTALGVGFITPPIGLNLYVLAGISDEPIMKIAKHATPYMVAMLAITLLIALVPGFFMWVV